MTKALDTGHEAATTRPERRAFARGAMLKALERGHPVHVIVPPMSPGRLREFHELADRMSALRTDLAGAPSKMRPAPVGVWSLVFIWCLVFDALCFYLP